MFPFQGGKAQWLQAIHGGKAQYQRDGSQYQSGNALLHGRSQGGPPLNDFAQPLSGISFQGIDPQQFFDGRSGGSACLGNSYPALGSTLHGELTQPQSDSPLQFGKHH